MKFKHLRDETNGEKFYPITHAKGVLLNNGNNIEKIIETISADGNVGTATKHNVPVSGNAAPNEVVLGSDTRLSDSRPAKGGNADSVGNRRPNNTANNLVVLNSNGKIPSNLIDDTILGGLRYMGIWSAKDNHPTLPHPSSASSQYYIVSTAGSYNGIEFNVGDWAISDGESKWNKIDNTDAVASVAGRTGNIVLAIADISELEETLNSKVTKDGVKVLSDVNYSVDDKSKVDKLKLNDSPNKFLNGTGNYVEVNTWAVDNTTLNTDSNTLRVSAVPNKNTNGSNPTLMIWQGTKAQYDQDYSAGLIKPHWICFIED